MSGDKLRQFVPPSWTWIFIGLLICLAVKAMQTRMVTQIPTANVASIFTLFH